MITKAGSTEIVNFMTPGAWFLVLERGHISFIMKMHYLKIFFCTFGDGSDKPKKTVLMMCLLIPITKTAYIAASSAIVDFCLFMIRWGC